MPTKIGFIGSSAPSSPHHDSFRAFIPRDISFSFVQETGIKGSLYDARGKLDTLISEVKELSGQQGWHGIIISGAPKEALNPGMWQRVVAKIEKPVALALRSSVAALKAFRAKNILLMTPVDDELKKLYRDYLAEFEIESLYPPQTLRAHTDAQSSHRAMSRRSPMRVSRSIPLSMRSISRVRCSIRCRYCKKWKMS